jgi:hypothetical protein
LRRSLRVGYNLQFEKLSQMLDLGQIIGTPTTSFALNLTQKILSIIPKSGIY